MNKYHGSINLSDVGSRTFNAVRKLCKLEAANNPENFGYRSTRNRASFVFTEAAANATVVQQLCAIMEANGDAVKQDETDVADSKEPVKKEKDDAAGSKENAQEANTTETSEPIQADAATDEPSSEAEVKEAVAEEANGEQELPTENDNGNPGTMPDKDVMDNTNFYRIPRGIDVADDMDELFNDLIITTGITDADHPLFNLRHPVMRDIITADNPSVDCPESVAELNSAIKEINSPMLTGIFGKSTSTLLGLLSPFFANAFKADVETENKAFELKKKFGSLFGKSKQSARPSFAMSKFGKTAANIMNEILSKTGQSRTTRNRIAIAADSIDMENLDTVDEVEFHELSATGQIDHNKLRTEQPSKMSGDILRHWYQYVNPYSSAATYMKCFNFSNVNPLEKQRDNQDIQAAQKASSPKETYRKLVNDNALEYLIFSPRKKLHEYDMISNRTIDGNGQKYHALTMKTSYGTVVGFYTENEIAERFN